jgi:2-dehydro-3-deoxygalactonokinase
LEEITLNEGIADTHRRWRDTKGTASDRKRIYLTVIAGALKKLGHEAQRGAPLIISGMASSSVGLEEVPYAHFPFSGRAEELTVRIFPETNDLPHPYIVVSGFQTATDVMRGEETMLLGCDITQYDKATLVFPGTHSKHVQIVGGVAVDFKTYVTGEMFNLLASHSLLSASVAKGEDKDSFRLGVAMAQELPLLHAIFRVRTRQLLDRHSPESNYQYLSGLLIGNELRTARDSTAPIVLVCEEPLSGLYRDALLVIDERRKMTTIDSRHALLRGHQLIAGHYHFRD